MLDTMFEVPRRRPTGVTAIAVLLCIQGIFRVLVAVFFLFGALLGGWALTTRSVVVGGFVCGAGWGGVCVVFPPADRGILGFWGGFLLSGFFFVLLRGCSGCAGGVAAWVGGGGRGGGGTPRHYISCVK